MTHVERRRRARPRTTHAAAADLQRARFSISAKATIERCERKRPRARGASLRQTRRGGPRDDLERARSKRRGAASPETNHVGGSSDFGERIRASFANDAAASNSARRSPKAQTRQSHRSPRGAEGAPPSDGVSRHISLEEEPTSAECSLDGCEKAAVRRTKRQTSATTNSAPDRYRLFRYFCMSLFSSRSKAVVNRGCAE